MAINIKYIAIFNLFSKRQKRLRGEVPEIYTYDKISQQLRVQIVHILDDAIGSGYCSYLQVDIFKIIHKSLCREFGVFSLSANGTESYKNNVLNFLLQTENIENVIDVIELSFKFIDGYIREYHQVFTQYANVKITPNEAIDELNQRFKEHGFGYQFESGEIIKINSIYIHSEIVKPTLALLWNPKLEGANEEYLKAHEYYRHNKNKECLTECLKAFESTMKIICIEKRWQFGPTDTSKKLIQICFQNNLVPAFTQNQFTSLQNLLESGIPTIRNKLSGHGQGQVPQSVDDKMTRYGLNLTGTNIIFLVEQSGII